MGHASGASAADFNKIAGHIFGTDGIRAVAGNFPLTPEGVRRIGAAAGQVLRSGAQGVSRKILVGKDTRESCGWIEKELAKGLAASGCETVSCGVLPTSAVSALLQKKGFLAGAVISASHNPAEFNGIKFFTSHGKKLPDAWEDRIESILLSGRKAGASRPAALKPFPDARGRYLQFLKKALPGDFSLRGMRWVLDCANGAASAIAPDLFRSLGAEVFVIHHKPDGKNINLRCGATHPQTLRQAVLKHQADGGCAFDGDADRAQFVDEKGRLMDGDILISLAAKAMKKNKTLRKNCVVTTVMANLGFFQEMEKSGIRVVTANVGDKAVADALKSSGAVLGGEQSGHIIFNRFLPTGDGILTALKIMEFVRTGGKPFSHFTDSFPKRPQVLLNVTVRERVPIEKVPALKKAIHEAERGLNKKGRILVRYSGTEPLLRIMVQGNSSSQIQKAAESVAAAAAVLQ